MKPFWLVGSVLLAAWLVWRRRRLEPTLLVGGAIAVVVAFIYGLGVIHLPHLEDLLINIGEALGKWTYLLVGALAFLETGAGVGLLAPGETALLIGGLVAGQGRIDLLTLIAIVWFCAVAGDLTSFALGRRLGRPFLVRHGPRVSITEERLVSVEDFFERHGGKAILLGRFVGIVRAVAPFMAGSSGMRLRRFVPYDVIGAGLWGTTFVLLGYVFWQSFDQLLAYAKKGALALGSAIALVVAIVWVVRWLRAPGNRDRLGAFVDAQAQRPALAPIARVVGPIGRRIARPARFAWARLTPGDLGLEVTTLLAVAGVGFFTYTLNLMRVQRPGFQVGDLNSLRVADRLDLGVAVSTVKVVTDLGALPVATALVVLASAVLVWRGDRITPAALVAGLGLTYVLVHLTKNAVDRPRPARPLIETDDSSFVSGHAAYAVTWVAVAIAVGRVLPGIAARFAFLTVALVVTVLVGLSRIYLRVHYLSDVVAGWSIAGALFSLCGIGALVVAHLRNNAPARR